MDDALRKQLVDALRYEVGADGKQVLHFEPKLAVKYNGRGELRQGMATWLRDIAAWFDAGCPHG